VYVAKKSTQRTTGGVLNEQLQTFLIELAVRKTLRDQFSKGNRKEREAILLKFDIGPDTRAAILSADDGRVRARLRVSDQNGHPPKPLVKGAHKAGRKK